MLCHVRLNRGKPADRMTVNDNVPAEHGIRPNPESVISVQRFIDDNGLERFAVPGYGHNLIVVALVVSVTAGSQIGNGRQLGHWII